MNKFSSLFIFLFFYISVKAQLPNYSVGLIPENLIQNANTVIRLSDRAIIISNQKSMKIVAKTVTTVLNETGMKSLYLSEYYNKSTKISKIEAKVYNANGLEIKTLKRRDFKDVSVADGFSVFNDSRMLYLDYTPTVYPFTVEYEVEMETSNTAFVYPWFPVTRDYESIENSKYSISAPLDLGLRYKENNFKPGQAIQKNETSNNITYSIQNVEAIRPEEYAPDFLKTQPYVRFALNKFHLEGVNGEAENWAEFGKWYYDTLLKETDELPVETVAKIKNLVGSETNPIAISKIVYDYVQQKTRYVSVQVGIGGWKPMLAKDVDRLGYGDCKALTNYTRTLLQAVNVPSYYTVVYSGSDKQTNIIEDFASVQGNHVILAVPYNNEFYWLECTSQTLPFAFQGDFTDGRKVLLVKPEGGQIVTTKTFTENESKRFSVGDFILNDKGAIKGVIKINSTGIEYDYKHGTERLSHENKVKYYKSYYNNINNLKVEKVNTVNNKDKIVFDEEIEISAEGYASKTGDRLIIPVNLLNPMIFVPKKYKNRDKPFEVLRGRTLVEECYLTIPTGYSVETLPEGISFETKYGSYSSQISFNNKNQLVFKKTYIIKKGFYEKENFEEFRSFLEKVSRNDNAKAIIKLN